MGLPLRNRENKNGPQKSQSLTMLENCEESIHFVDPEDKEDYEILKNARKNWKDQWHQPCRAKDIHTASESGCEVGRVHPKRLQKHFMNAWWNLMNPQGNEWNLLYIKKPQKITLHAKVQLG